MFKKLSLNDKMQKIIDSGGKMHVIGCATVMKFILNKCKSQSDYYYTENS